MKRVLGVWLALALLVCGAALPAAAQPASAVDAMIDQLAQIMDAREQIYRLRRRALDGLEAFWAANDYASLVGARLACDEASRELKRVTAPELELSDEALMELMRSGVETDALELEIEDVRALVEGEAGGIELYEALLYSSAYQLSQLSALEDWLEIGRARTELDIAYDFNWLNYLLLPLADDPAVSALWAEAPERWPELGAKQPEWESESAAILSAAEEILSGYEALSASAAEALGRDAYAVEQFDLSVLNGDDQALRADINHIADMPTMLPLPADWLSPEASELYASDESGDGLPGALIARDVGVTLEQFMGYAELLISLGARERERTGSDEEGWRCALTMGEEPLLLDWRPDGTAMAAYDPRRLTLERPFYIAYAR